MATIDDLVQAMHDSLCSCGERCFGFEQDKAWLEENFTQRWGSIYPLRGFLGECEYAPK